MASATDPNGQDKTYPGFLDKRYDSISKIGQGGMGAVYKAFDNDLLKEVVIKVIVSDDDYEKYAIEFQKEAKALSRLKNDNLVTVYDFGISDNGTLYMVLEYVKGENLSQVLDQAKQLSPQKALPIFMQVCAGLIHAHSNHVIHRDLKPANVIIGKDSEGKMLVKIIDFGIAKVEDGQSTSTELDTIKGSPFYLAPEVIKGKRATEQSDIYSFGCLMFKTLTGKVPFEGETIFETFDKHTKEAVPLVTDLLKDCPGDLSDLIHKCMSKDPTDRYNFLAEIEEELDSIYHGRVELQNSIGIQLDVPDSKLSSDSKTTNALILLVAILGLGIGGLTIYSLVSGNMFRKESETLESKKSKSPFKHPHHAVTDPFHLGSIYNVPAWKAVYVESSDKEVAAILLKKRPLNISLMHSKVNGTLFNSLVNWPIDTLRLESSEITDEGVKAISRIKTVKNLDLTATNITDKGLIYLRDLPLLRHIELSMCPKVTESGVIGLLQNCKSVESIKLKQLKITSLVVPYLVSKNLHSIELASTNLGDSDIFKLSKIPNLREIDISNNRKVSEKTFLAFANLPNLTKFECSNLPNIPIKTIEFYREKFKAEHKFFNCTNIN